jgi:hypothetical protein
MAKTYWTAGRRDPVSLTNLREFQRNYFLCRNLFCFLFSKIGAKSCRLSLRGFNFYVIDRSIESHTLKEELEIFWWLRGGEGAVSNVQHRVIFCFRAGGYDTGIHNFQAPASGFVGPRKLSSTHATRHAAAAACLCSWTKSRQDKDDAAEWTGCRPHDAQLAATFLPVATH